MSCVVECPTCKRMWVTSSVPVGKATPHYTPGDPPVGIRQEWVATVCHTMPYCVDRPDVLAAWLLGGDPAVRRINAHEVLGDDEPST